MKEHVIGIMIAILVVFVLECVKIVMMYTEIDIHWIGGIVGYGVMLYLISEVIIGIGLKVLIRWVRKYLGRR